MTDAAFPMTRRDALKLAAIAGAGTALGAFPFAARLDAQQGELITKPIPSTGERVPVIGLGTNVYGRENTPEEYARLKGVIARMAELGGKVIDTAHGYGRSEETLGRILTELKARDKFFLATKCMAPKDDLATAREQFEGSFKKLQTDRIDLMFVHNMTGAGVLLPFLEEMKKEGRIRYIGATTSNTSDHAAMAALMRKHKMDWVQVNYSIDERSAEKEIFPLALEQGTAVMLNVPLGGRRGSLFARVKGRDLPEWAREFDATSWAHFFLKYSVGHPAVTCVIPGTTQEKNLADNQGAGRGRLPDAALRRKMEEFWATIPEA
jgi:aryl-alcohol dehydrogenase-like predicted oxidoreductase